MKYCSASITLLLFLFLTGCIKDDYKDCLVTEQNNLELKFVYINNQDKDIFADHINRVHLFIYDADYKLFKKQIVEKNNLEKDRSIALYLPSGKYYILCWGNALNKTSFINTELSKDLKDAYAENNSVDVDGFATNGDPLYYAPKSNSELMEVIVPEVGKARKEVPFKSAHANIQVYVKGFEDYNPEGKSLKPVIELSNIPDKYDFQLGTSNTFIAYKDVAEYGLESDKNTAFLQFHTPLFEEDTLLELKLKKSSTTETLITIRLSEFISKNQIDFFGVDQILIPIIIEFKGTDISIELLSWENILVDPELKSLSNH